MKPVTNLRLLSVITLASSSLFFSACEKKAAESTEGVEVEQAVDTLDSLTDELVVQLNQYADIVLAVKDTATAQEAVTNLNTVADAIAAIAARLDKIEIPDEAANIAVDEKMKTASMAIKQKMQAAGEIMSNEEVAGILIPLQNFGKRMAEQEKVFMRFGSQKNKAPQQQPAPAATPADAPVAEAAAPAAETPAAAAPAAEAAAPATPAPAAE